MRVTRRREAEADAGTRVRLPVGSPHARLWQHGNAALRAAERAAIIQAVLADWVTVAARRVLARPRAARWRTGVRVG